jgi:hypothetical protein
MPHNLTPEQQILLLQFWSLSVEIARNIRVDTRESIEGLQQALELVSAIPVAIGWETEDKTDELRRYVTGDEAFRRKRK